MTYELLSIDPETFSGIEMAVACPELSVLPPILKMILSLERI